MLEAKTGEIQGGQELRLEKTGQLLDCSQICWQAVLGLTLEGFY